MKPSYCEKCGAKTCLDGTNIHICIMKSTPVKKTSDEKALEEYDLEFGNLSKSIHPSITSRIKSFIIKTRQESKEEERQRILSLPCMEREEAPEEVHDLDNQLELIQGLANFNWNSGRNFLRRELKEEINI